MLMEYLKENYKENELIFFSDIQLPVTENALRQMCKSACDRGLLKRADKGIYYLPKTSRLNGSSGISADQILTAKYITRSGRIFGYTSGYTFANQLGLTTQVPYTEEIVTNNTSQVRREINLAGQKAVLRKPAAEINSENCRILQFLDLLKDVDQVSDLSMEQTRSILQKYVLDSAFLRSDIDRFIRKYPERIYRNYYDMRIDHVLA